MKKILLTCFEPFGGEEKNVTMDVSSRISNRVGFFEIEKLTLPVEFSRAADVAIKYANDICADAVISLGQAGARSKITPEMVAINLRHASIPDNAGAKPEDEPVIAGAQNAYFATLPVRKISERISEYGCPSAVSYSAGTYVCNDLYFSLLHSFGKRGVRVCFIHLPKESAELSADRMAYALEKMIGNLAI
jgi:pyroglutamyl-peptidase